MTAKEKMTAPVTSVGADVEQPLQNFKTNCENDRYGLLSMDLWIDTGFHCGEYMEVLVDDQWVQTRMEMNLAREWYLVGTPYCGDLEYIRARISD